MTTISNTAAVNTTASVSSADLGEGTSKNDTATASAATGYTGNDTYDATAGRQIAPGIYENAPGVYSDSSNVQQSKDPKGLPARDILNIQEEHSNIRQETGGKEALRQAMDEKGIERTPSDPRELHGVNKRAREILPEIQDQKAQEVVSGARENVRENMADEAQGQQQVDDAAAQRAQDSNSGPAFGLGINGGTRIPGVGPVGAGSSQTIDMNGERRNYESVSKGGAVVGADAGIGLDAKLYFNQEEIAGEGYTDTVSVGFGDISIDRTSTGKVNAIGVNVGLSLGLGISRAETETREVGRYNEADE